MVRLNDDIENNVKPKSTKDRMPNFLLESSFDEVVQVNNKKFI